VSGEVTRRLRNSEAALGATRAEDAVTLPRGCDRDKGASAPRLVRPSVSPVEAAFFDLDKTVIAKASLLAYGATLRREGYISHRLAVRAALGQVVFRVFGADDRRMAKVRDASLRMARGWDQARLRALVEETLHDVIEPIVYEEALDLLRAHRRAGRRIYLVSSSPAEIVDPLAVYLGTDGAVSTRARIDADGRYTGEVEFYAHGPTKAAAIRALAAEQGIDLDASYAYSDSATDLPMLSVVGHPVAVNPDRDLRRAAVANGWEVRTFEHPVPLRARVSLPATGRTVKVVLLVGALVLAGTVGALGFRMLRRRSSAAPPAAETGS
jgi:HAD superfamily hydrolase (TIGR01490 family)